MEEKTCKEIYSSNGLRNRGLLCYCFVSAIDVEYVR